MADIADRATAAPAIRTLLAGAIDYAGLYPPAALAMDQAVRNYASYRVGTASWALGRFVAPVARLAELRAAAEAVAPTAAFPWRVAALAGPGGPGDWPTVRDARGGRLLVDALELRAASVNDVAAVAERLPADLDVFYEIPADRDPQPLVSAIGAVGGKAKIRTGGVTIDAFPRTVDVARFIVACARTGVPFKATAGLHHVIRASYRLTYEARSASGEMLGFLNLLLASAFARAGAATDEVSDILAERAVSSFRFRPDAVEWRGRRLTTEALAETRASLALSFGSCSFTEPIGELEALGLL